MSTKVSRTVLKASREGNLPAEPAALVAGIVASTIESLDLQYPKVTDEKRRQIEAARRQLEKE